MCPHLWEFCVITATLLVLQVNRPVLATTTTAVNEGAGGFTDTEKETIKNLRELMKDELYDDYMQTDGYLIPWLRAKGLDVQKAKEMLQKNLKWRKEHNIETKMVVQVVLILPVGAWDFRKAALAGQIGQLSRYMVKVLLEVPSRLSRESHLGNGVNGSDSNSNQWIFVPDLSGYNLRQQGCVACLPVYLNYITNYEKYYRQHNKETLLINVPRIFNPIIELTKPFWSAHLLAHVQIVGSDKADISRVLSQFIASDQIPIQYGGISQRRVP